jgi:hypothetical protein
MALAQLSPATLVVSPTNINPLAQANSTATAAVVGTVAQKSTQRAKSDSVTISREAMAKASEAESGKGTQTRDAANKTKEK